MKRLLLVFVLSAALLGLLAAPALAKTKTANFRPALMTAYVFTYNGGSWFEGTGDPSAPTLVPHWAATDDAGNWIVGTADPVPANYDVVMQESIKLIPRGEVQTLPKKFLISLSIPEAGVDISYEQAKAYWTGPELWDDYWVTHMWPIVPFNPNIGAQTYANRWLAPLTGDNGLATNLTTEKKLPPGPYTVIYTERVVQPFTDLELFTDDQGNPLRVWEWTHARPYTSDPLVCTFTVAPPE